MLRYSTAYHTPGNFNEIIDPYDQGKLTYLPFGVVVKMKMMIYYQTLLNRTQKITSEYVCR